MDNLDQNTILELIRFEVEDMHKQLKEEYQLAEKIRLDFRARKLLDQSIRFLEEKDYENSYLFIREVMDLINT